MSFSTPHKLRPRRKWKVTLDNFNEEVVCCTVNYFYITDKERTKMPNYKLQLISMQA
ncbi:hypothetical protein C0J52_11008 [Blattella germanica]|nr:hypothetical protein C0J52_11008 [Blattella germanica]